jgi:ribosomal protein S18 acetylase RimI-like enzyme
MMTSSPGSRGMPRLEDISLLSLSRPDIAALEAVLRANQPTFSDRECETAVAMMHEAIAEPAGDDPYQFVLARLQGQTLGYACFGTIPLTQGSYDLYWIVVRPDFHARGIGKTILLHSEAVMARQGGRLVIAETSSRSEYARARRFYEDVMGYEKAACIRDYYQPGDDRLLYIKYLRATGDAGIKP